MNELPHRLAELLDSGGYAVMLPLFLCCAWVWIIFLERLSSIGHGPWTWIIPSARRKATRDRQALEDALESFAESPSRNSREAVVAASRTQPGPYALFLRRVIGGARTSSRPSSRRLLEIRLLEASLAAEHESGKGLAIIPALTRAALLLGLLGTVIGLEGMFREMAVSGPSDFASWQTGVSAALVSGEVGIVVALSGIAAGGWLSHRAKAIADDIRSTCLRLRQIRSRPSSEAFS